MLYIYTVCYNTPQYVEFQYKLLQKFIVNPFTYIVFNNTMTNTRISQEDIANNQMLNDICKKYDIKVVALDKSEFDSIRSNSASLRAGTAINMAHKYLFENYDLDSTFFLIDTDAFLLSLFDVEEFIKNKKISGRLQLRKTSTETVKYITNHVVIYKPSTIDLNHFSFLPCTVNGARCDCGGNINYILNKIENNEFVNWTNSIFSEKGNLKQQLGTAPSLEEDFDLNYFKQIENYDLKKYIFDDTYALKKKHPFCEILENEDKDVTILHMRAGTNWIGFDIKKRNEILFNFLKKVIS